MAPGGHCSPKPHRCSFHDENLHPRGTKKHEAMLKSRNIFRPGHDYRITIEGRPEKTRLRPDYLIEEKARGKLRWEVIGTADLATKRDRLCRMR